MTPEQATEALRLLTSIEYWLPQLTQAVMFLGFLIAGILAGSLFMSFWKGWD